MNILAKVFKKETVKTQFGLSENDHYFCLVYLQQGNIIAHWQAKTAEMPDFQLQAVEFPQNFTIIRPIPFHYIWRKYLFLPSTYSEHTLYRQLLQVLRQELPLPLEDVYFDYQLFPLPDEGLTRVILYALRKTYADLHQFDSDTVLDCEFYCFLRGFHYLRTGSRYTGEEMTPRYQLQDKTFQLTGKGVEIGTDLRQADYSLAQLDLPAEVLDPHLYVTALGACLWNGAVSI